MLSHKLSFPKSFFTKHIITITYIFGFRPLKSRIFVHWSIRIPLNANKVSHRLHSSKVCRNKWNYVSIRLKIIASYHMVLITPKIVKDMHLTMLKFWWRTLESIQSWASRSLQLSERDLQTRSSTWRVKPSIDIPEPSGAEPLARYCDHSHVHLLVHGLAVRHHELATEILIARTIETYY